MSQLGSGRWLGAVWRFLVTLFFLLLILFMNRCSELVLPGAETPTVTAAIAHLRVDVRPEGAAVYVDGQAVGTTPFSLELEPGPYSIRVELQGFEPLDQGVDLGVGEEAVISGSLAPSKLPVAPTVTLIATPMPSPEPVLPDLKVHYVKIELQTGGACDYTSTQLGLTVAIQNAGGADAGPFVVDVNGCPQSVDSGLVSGQAVSLWFGDCGYQGEQTVVVDATFRVKESDEDNNTFSGRVPIPTLPPTCTPPPEPPTGTPPPPSTFTPSPPSTLTPTARPPQPVAVREGQVTIATYPYDSFTAQAWSDAFNMAYTTLDRVAYDASNPVPVDATYRTLVVDNEYLKLTFLPDLGGRIYEVIFKPTGHRETYRNPVLKPSPWGPPEQGWWLAAGGFEWGLPVEEHGYEWGVPWMAQISQDAQGATVTLRDTTANDRVRAAVSVRLEAGAGRFTIQPRIENPTGAPLAAKYWTNAMLAPGGRNLPSDRLRFVLPEAVTAVTVHSRGDGFLPDYNERLPWPVFNDLDLSKLGNWNRWLGFFENPAAGKFIAAYDEGYDEGMVRVFSADAAPGAKCFAFGWKEPIPAYNWTDDGSSYIEIHGGPSSTFDDSVTIPAGGHVQWTETWYPVAGLGGLRYANDRAALNLEASDGRVQVAVAVTRAWSGDVVLLLNGQETWRRGIALVPGQPFRDSVSLGDGIPQTGHLAIRLEGSGGVVVAEYDTESNLK
jgi:hypothetical protein